MADVVNFGVLFGMQPPDIVRYFESKGLVETGAWTQHWQEAHAKGFTVANVLRADVLQDIHASVADLLVQGKSPAEVKKELIAKLEQKGWFAQKGEAIIENGKYVGKKLTARRIDTILATNRASAYGAARWRQAWAVRELKPFVRYNHNHAERPRASHLAMNGWVFPIDDPFWDTHWPPNGWHCHCDTSSLSMRDVERYGITDNMRTGEGNLSTEVQVLPDGTRAQVTTYTDPKTGRKIATQPGFNFNVGKAHYQPNLDQYEPRVARAYIAGTLRGDDFKFVYQKCEQLVKDNPDLPLLDVRRLAGQTKFPVGMLRDELQKVIGAKTGVVLLSEDTMVKQVVKRTGQDFGIEDYWRVQGVLENAQLIVLEGGLHLSFFELDGVWYQAVVKATKDGRELYLQTFHRANERQMNSVAARGRILYDVRKK